MSTVLEYVKVRTEERRFCPRAECSDNGCALGLDPERNGSAQYAHGDFSEDGRALTGALYVAEAMHVDFQLGTLLLGIVIFLARVVDVSMGTMRTISIVQGRTKIAFVLGFLEVSIWLMVISAVVNDVMTKPLLGVFYALGFSTGNVVGIRLERRLAFGHIIFRVISTCNGKKIAEKVRDSGYAVTTFEGEGKCGPVTMLYVVCRRRDLNEIIPLVKSIEPDAFYITEQAGSVSKIFRPVLQPLTGWRAIFKKK